MSGNRFFRNNFASGSRPVRSFPCAPSSVQDFRNRALSFLMHPFPPVRGCSRNPRISSHPLPPFFLLQDPGACRKGPSQHFPLFSFPPNRLNSRPLPEHARHAAHPPPPPPPYTAARGFPMRRPNLLPSKPRGPKTPPGQAPVLPQRPQTRTLRPHPPRPLRRRPGPVRLRHPETAIHAHPGGSFLSPSAFF